MGYFDLDDILCEEQPLKSTFTAAVPWTRPFFSKDSAGMIEANAIYELPYWMACPLAINGRVTVSLPRCYGLPVREQLLMDARTVQLDGHCHYFHEFAIKLMAVVADDQLYTVVLNAFLDRCPEIVCRSMNCDSGSDPAYTEKLDHTERLLFQAGHE